MPKVKTYSVSRSSLLNDYVNEFGRDVFETNGKFIKCKVCNSNLGDDKSAPQKSQVEQHIKTAKHQHNLQLKLPKQGMIKFTSNEENTFYMDLCELFVSNDIAITKLNNDNFRLFFKKHFKVILPEESTLRKNYLPKIYEKMLNEIRSNLLNEKIWVSIDETTNASGKAIGNVVVGALKNEPSKCFLLACEILEQTNHSAINQLFNNAMILLYETHIKYGNVLLLVTDAARYMVKAGNAIKNSYPNMIHLTCVVHGLNRVAEQIRINYPLVNKLISNVKKIYCKAPSRISKFKLKGPQTPLPPQPVITRWGTWLEAAIYYCENFNLIKDLVNDLDIDEADSIKITQNLFKSPELRSNLAFISANFSGLASAMKQLEKRNLKLENSIDLIEKQFNSIMKSKENNITSKFIDVLRRNNGYQEIKLISKILNGEHNLAEQLEYGYSPNEINAFSFAPLTSVDVERSFSFLKHYIHQENTNLLLKT